MSWHDIDLYFFNIIENKIGREKKGNNMILISGETSKFAARTATEPARLTMSKLFWSLSSKQRQVVHLNARLNSKGTT